MHSSWLTRTLLSGLAVASIGAAPAAVALASPHHHAHKVARVHRADARDAATENASESQGREADGDAAAQAAACARAGVSGDNVQYDGSTGACSADTGSNGQQQQQ